MDDRHEPSTLIYTVHPRILIEGFDDGALAFRLDDRHLVDLNPTAHFILEHTDGQRSAADIAALVAQTFETAHDEALTDVCALYEDLVRQNMVRLFDASQKQSVGGNMTETLYVRNPDVGLREEDEDGGLLFNPDTHQIQAINTTGLFIWKLCDGAHTLTGVVDAMLDEYEGAPVEDMRADAEAFIQMMIEIGFIGTVEEAVRTAEGVTSNG